MSECFDLIVVGAGPAGMAAAAVAAEAGKKVCLIDDNAAPGGQIWRGYERLGATKRPHVIAYRYWESRLRQSDCAMWAGYRVIAIPRPNHLRLENDRGSRDVAYRNLILATGARERFLPFPGWTLPGVLGVGGLQAMVKSGFDPRGKRVVIAGTGPLLLAIASGLSEADAEVVGIYEQAPLARLSRLGAHLLRHPEKLIEGTRYRSKTLRAPYRAGSWVTQVEGSGRVEKVYVTNGRKIWMHECDLLACGFHLVPNLELPQLLGCRIAGGYVEVDRKQQSSVAGVACVGELTGIGGMDKAILEGQIAGWVAAENQREADSLAEKIGPYLRFAQQLDRAFALRDELRHLARSETLVCRCEDVAHAKLKECRGWREAKLHTRCGMGACQGRVCGPATEFLYGWQHDGVRPPVFPATVAAVAQRGEIIGPPGV